MRTVFVAWSIGCVWAQVPASQTPPPPPIISPEVHADRTVTFRFRDPNAKEVLLAREGDKRAPMAKDDNGVWSITTSPLEPDYYGYTFIADGVSLVDPANSVLKPNLRSLSNMVHVPGPSSLPWESSDVPHGEVHHHFYKSDVIGDDRDYYVYTPPGYDSKSKHGYPVLYLFHGFSDDASAWTAVGRANVILDNLIAQGKAKPMLIVMPLGYGVPDIVRPGSPGLGDPETRDRNYAKFRDALFLEVMPQVQKGYNVLKDRSARAIAGLSMGGAESLYIGLNSLDKFSWIGSFSAGGSVDTEKMFSLLDAKANAQIHLLWIACGTDDRLIEPNRKFREFLTAKGVRHEAIETPGAHVWMVWRRNLAAFAPLLFQTSGI
jgi:enterochelin esterase-like enzyme